MKNKGFTLVELLAVIVVLAIIMVIAIPNIMRSMDNSKKGTFKVYAQRVLTKAEERYQSDQFLGNDPRCYTIEGLDMGQNGKYRGKVVINVAALGATPEYFITMSNNAYSVTNASYENVENIEKDGANKIELGAPIAVGDATLNCPTP